MTVGFEPQDPADHTRGPQLRDAVMSTEPVSTACVYSMKRLPADPHLEQSPGMTVCARQSAALQRRAVSEQIPV